DLLHKTNQFNLTTRRHSAEELRQILADPHCVALTVRVTDRFGDNGIVGAAIVRVQGDAATLDSFLLSCRVIGRRVETALLVRVTEWARRQGASYLIGEFLPTTKNAPAAGFFVAHGFAQVGGGAEGSRWLLDLDFVPYQWPECMALSSQDPTASSEESVDDDRLLRTISEVLRVDTATLSDDASPQTIPSWDSLNHLNLVLALESEFDISLPPEDALALQSVGKIREILNRSGEVSSTDSVVFVDCQPHHIPAVKAFISKSYGPRYVLGANDAYFTWQYQGIPTGSRSDFSLRLALVQGNVAACLGYIPVDVDIAGQRYDGCWLANWMVDPDYRHLGIGPLLAREISRQFSVTLALGANDDARDILSRMGWTDFQSLARYVCVLDHEGAKSLTPTGQLDWPQFPADGGSSTGRDHARVARVDRFSNEVEEFTDRFRAQDRSAAGTRRSTRYLNWRYADHPQFSYRLFVASCRSDVTGMAVYRVEQARDLPLRVGRIVEIIADEQSQAPLLTAMLADARQQGAVAADFFCSSQRVAALFERHGFLPGQDARTQQIPMLYQPIDRRRTEIRFLADLRAVGEHAAELDWYVTKADGDQDRPN
ncbi:MAG: hypothetical protein AB7O38_22490, partial [Pirellulaceae bacterium]